MAGVAAETTPVTAAMCAAGRVLGDPRPSPDGSEVAFVAVESGRPRVVVVPSAGGPEQVVSADLVPRAVRPLGGGVLDWFPDGRSLAVAGAGGLWRQPVGGGPPSLLHPCDDLASPAVAPDGAAVVVVDGARRVVVVPTTGAAPRVVGWEADFAADPDWSPDGRWLAWVEWDAPAMPWQSSRIVVAPADGSSAPVMVAGGPGVQVQQPRFSPAGDRLAFLSDASGWLNLTVVGIADGRPAGEAARLDEPFEHGGPQWAPGQRSYAWAPDGRALVVDRNEGGFGRLVRWEPGGAASDVAKAVHGGLSWRGERIVAVRTGGRTPTQVVSYDAAGPSRRATLAVGPVAGLADGPEPEVVRWPGEAGEVPGRLYRPGTSAAGDPPPLLVWVHGGPTDQWRVEHRARFLFWLSRGWAILVPDHRGSTGHGRAHAAALEGRWGEADTADVVAGIAAAAEGGWGDPGRVAVMGSSAGGFVVLHLLAAHPGLCAAGVDVFGVVDPSVPSASRFEARYHESLGGSAVPVEHIVDPLLVLHGGADDVVPVAHSERLANRLAALGRTVELQVYEGEGHGWGRPEVVVDELERTARFLDRYVLGVFS